MKKIFLITLWALCAMAGCRNKAELDNKGMPQTLIIGAVQTEGVDEIKKIREQIRQYLEKKLGIPVELIYSNDYVGVIEALRAKKIHMADLPPFSYVIATRSIKLTPIVTLGNNGKPSSYQSVLIVNARSNLKSIADIKARSKSLSLSFVDPASASGHLVPRAYLNAIGLDPNTSFKQTIFSGSHLASVLSVKSGKVDIGCTTNLVFGLMIRGKMLNEGDLRVLWTSAPIVSDPVAVRSDLNPLFIKKIQQAYLDMNTEAPGILKSYVKLLLRDTTRRSYMVAQDSLYDGLRKIANSVKGLQSN